MKKNVAAFFLLAILLLSGCGVNQTPPASTNTSQANTTVASTKILASMTSSNPLPPGAFLATGRDLAKVVSSLNQAQLNVIRQAQSGKLIAEDDLLKVAAEAMRVGQFAEQLSLTVNAQEGTQADNAQSYTDIARLSYALLLETQLAREAGSVNNDEVVHLMASYGARLWNPAVVESGSTANPFVALLDDPTDLDLSAPLDSTLAQAYLAPTGTETTVALFMASSNDTETKTIRLGSTDLAKPLPDNAAFQKLTTVDGQRDGLFAKAVTAKELAKNGGTVDETAGTVSTLISKGITVVQDPLQSVQNLPVFNNGTARTIKQQVIKGVADQVIADVADIAGVNTAPRVTATTPVKAVPPPVKISVSNIVRSIATQIELDVTWSTSQPRSDLRIFCNVSGLSQNQEVEVTGSGGTMHVTIPFTKSPANNQFEVFCFAKESEDSPTLGYSSTSAEVPVTVPSNSNANAVLLPSNTNNNAVLPSSNSSGSTATSNANTPLVQNLNAATSGGTVSPNANLAADAWIEPYVQGIEKQLLANKLDPVSIAIVTNDLQNCLVAAVAAGKGEAAAKAECAASLRAQANANTAPGTSSGSSSSGSSSGSSGAVGYTSISVSADFSEAITNGAGDSFASHAVFTADAATKTISGTLSGSGSKEHTYDCYLEEDHSKIIDHGSAVNSYSYTSAITGMFDPISGEFTATISPAGPLKAQISKSYSDSRCTHLNETLPLNVTFNGKGTISGNLSSAGTVAFTTKWTSNEASVTGSYGGNATVR